MTTEQQSVKNWMAKAGQETPDKPTIPSLEVRKLRARLILEEAFETIRYGLGMDVHLEAIDSDLLASDFHFKDNGEPDLIELADGISDLQVVNLGTAVACGIDLEPCFKEVMRSNESKFQWTPHAISEAEQKCGYQIKNLEGLYSYCVTDVGGKVIKPPTYSPSNLSPILEGQK